MQVNGIYTLDGSTVVIQNNRFVNGSGTHWDHCRYTGEFKYGKAKVFGGPGSSWPHTETQEWVAQGDLMIVNGGKHVWKKQYKNGGWHLPLDGVYRLDSSTVEVRGGKIVGGTGDHWNHCRYTGEFHDGRATVFGGPGSSWPRTLTQSWVLQGNSMVVNGGAHVWYRL